MSGITRGFQNSFLLILISGIAPAMGHDVTVRIGVHKPVFALGEAVIVSATVVNNGTEAAKLMHHNAPTLMEDKVSTVDLLFGPDPERLKRWSDRLRDARRTNPRSLAPGESVTVDLVMLFNAEDGFFATEPGRYWIQGRIVAHDIGEVLSPPVPIEIREPSPSDRATWGWLNAHKEEYGRLVQIPWEAKPSDEFLQESARLCDTSPSAYVEYLALFLSRSYREGPKKDAVQAARFAEIAKGRATSEKIRAEADKILAAKPPPVSP
jgi:hypothetical protein